MPNFYYRSGPNEFGPLTTSQLKELASIGRITADDDIRRGSGEWVRAALFPGLFDGLHRPSELAVNEMDVVTEAPPAPARPDELPLSQRDTAFESQITRPATVRPQQRAATGSQPAVNRATDEPPVAWPRAVSALCYLSSLLGLALGGFSLFDGRSVTAEVLGGVCFLVAILLLGCGCVINLLMRLLYSRPLRKTP